MSVSGVVRSNSSRQEIRAILRSHLDNYFSGTLGTVDDIENIMMGLIHRETGFDPDKRHKSVGDSRYSTRTTAYRAWNSPVFKNVLSTGNAEQKANLEQAFVAWGLMGSMGWNHIRNAGGGPTEIERYRPDLAPQLMVNAGESVRDKMAGRENMSRQILAGLTMWEAKWRQVKGSGNSWQAGRYTFSTRILAATAAYLGLGPKDLKTGMTPEQYARSIVFGADYRAANNTDPKVASKPSKPNPTQAENKQQGPVQTAASGYNRQAPGC